MTSVQAVPDNIEIEVTNIVARGACVASVSLASRLVEDLECDSLDVIEMVMEAEDEFGIEITDDEACALKTVQQFVDCVRGKKVSHTP